MFAVGIVFCYICIILYLYGELSIYAAVVTESLWDVVW